MLHPQLMRTTLVLFYLVILTFTSSAQDTPRTDSTKTVPPPADSLVMLFPDAPLSIPEGDTLNFQFEASGGAGDYFFQIDNRGIESVMMDSTGRLTVIPDYTWVRNYEKTKDYTFRVRVTDGADTVRRDLEILVNHTNRPPVVKPLPVFFVAYNTNNTYDLRGLSNLIFDPDNDAFRFDPQLSQLPQGLEFTPDGHIEWKPSIRQYNRLRKDPLSLSFTVVDNEGLRSEPGQVRFAVTQKDLPPQITFFPNETELTIRENETLNIKFFLSDPNGENDIVSFDFVSERKEVQETSLKPVNEQINHYEFNWTPSYDFKLEPDDTSSFTIRFFVIDRSSQRVEKTFRVRVKDTENIQAKDNMLYEQYRAALVRAWDMIIQLEQEEKELRKLYSKANKGKRNRAITTASLGAITGLSPLFLQETAQEVTTGIGGTTTLTLGTLEASNVIGKSPSEIMQKLSDVIKKKNELEVQGNLFAGEYALVPDRRKERFANDLKKLTLMLNLNDIPLVELPANWKNPKSATDRNLNKVFPDYHADR